jgi:putative oxidoreductase
MMRRLHRSFPNGGAAIGLVLLRILSGGGLAEQSRRTLCFLFGAPESKMGTLVEIAVASALVASILIIIGLWTPAAAGAAVILGVASAALGFEPRESLFFACLSFAIALVGPGAFSLDARLFGWKQIRFPNTNRS